MSKKEPLELDGEEVWRRDPKERYGIFRVKDGGRPELVATCKTQGAVGTTVCRLGAEGEFLDHTLGIMDGRDHKNKHGDWVGKWLVLPWVTKASQAIQAGKAPMVYQAKEKAA